MMKVTLTTLFLALFLSASGQSSKKDPVKNFDALWSTFNDRYANFDLKGVNWQDSYDKYRPQISETTTTDELFDVSCKMLQDLRDGHINIIGKTATKKRHCGPPVSFHLKEEFGKVSKLAPLTHKTLEAENFSALSEEIGKGNIRFSASEDYGYLSIAEFEGFALGELGRSMKLAMKLFADKKGVIIDVRLNGGGSDRKAYNVAGYFTDKKRLGHYKKTRKKGTQTFTELKSWFLKPKGSYQFTKPVIVLTSDWSASATEIFVLGMNELPHVTTVGNRTEGIFSDMYGFNLPNGWWASLSHQQYFSADLVNYEGKGIEPDIKILNYKKDEFDNVLLKAIEVLNEKSK